MFHEERVRELDVIRLRACYSGVSHQIGWGSGDGIIINSSPVPLGDSRAGIHGKQIFCFSFNRNQDWPLIGQRKIKPPKFKSAHQSGVNFDFDEMETKTSVLR